MKKAVQNLWGQMGKRSPMKRNFSKQGRDVKLSLVDDAQSAFSDVEGAYSVTSYFAYEALEELDDKMTDIYMQVDDYIINSEMSYLPEASERLAEILDKIESSASDLGIDPSEIYPDFEDAREMTESSASVIDDLKREWDSSRVSRASNFDLPF
jgi:hypothetical protein